MKTPKCPRVFEFLGTILFFAASPLFVEASAQSDWAFRTAEEPLWSPSGAQLAWEPSFGFWGTAFDGRAQLAPEERSLSFGRVWFGSTLGAFAGLSAGVVWGFQDFSRDPPLVSLATVGSVLGASLLSLGHHREAPSIGGMVLGAIAVGVPVHFATEAWDDTSFGVYGTLLAIPFATAIGEYAMRRSREPPEP